MATDRHRRHKGLSADSRAAVILDSNFLFIPLRFGVDIFDELQRVFGRPVRYILLTAVIEELRLLRLNAEPSLKKEIDFAVSLTDRCEVMETSLNPSETVDDLILRIAVETDKPVATNDTGLKQRLRAAGIPVVYMRQQAYLEINGFV